ncbi:MAG: PD-(D/E)XK nuclease family protein [Geobacteraceae bacterium]|nr:PD-(D/E)XK nuclease family protein [Geobacteraceae bacterium]
MTTPLQMPPWSYSGLTSFETCPKRYYHIKVAKDAIDNPGEAAKWGSTVHKYLEDRLRDGTRLPVSVRGYEGLVAPIANAPGEKLVEHQMAVNSSLKPTEWTSQDAWCRGIVDAGVLSRSLNKAVLLDWKTGKRKADNDQLMLFAGLAFSHYPELQIVQTGFVWLKENKIDKQTFKREDISTIWMTFLPRVQRMERAYEKAEFPPNPSGLCRNYCPVPKHKCEFSGKQ